MLNIWPPFAGREDVDFETKLTIVHDIAHALPAANFDILKRIVEHLEKYALTPNGFVGFGS